MLIQVFACQLVVSQVLPVGPQFRFLLLLCDRESMILVLRNFHKSVLYLTYLEFRNATSPGLNLFCIIIIVLRESLKIIRFVFLVLFTAFTDIKTTNAFSVCTEQ